MKSKGAPRHTINRTYLICENSAVKSRNGKGKS